MDSKNFFKLLTAGALSLTALAGCSNDGGGTTDETVSIGLHYELKGDAADYGNAELRGSQLAIKLANENEDYQFTYEGIEYDNGSSENEAITISQRLISDGVVGVIGPSTSAPSAATYPILNDAQTIVVSPSATANNQTLVDPDDPNSDVYEYVYRVCFEDSYQGAAMAQFAVDTLGVQKVAVYGSVSSDYAKGLNTAFAEQLEKLGGQVVANESYQDGDTDFSAVLTSLASQEFDALYIPGYYNEAGLIIQQARELGIDCPIIGPDGFDANTLVELAGADNLNDVYFTTAYTTVDASEKLQAFIDAYTEEYGEAPAMFAALAFDATNLLIEAIEKAGTTDKATVNETIANMEFSGVTGDFTFDETHTPNKSVLVVELVDGVQETAVSVTPE